MRSARKILLFTATSLIVAIALLLTGLRLALPQINYWRHALLLQIASTSGMSVNASQLQAKWYHSGPTLQIQDLHLTLKDGGSLSAKRVSLTLDIWKSLLHVRWQFQELSFYQLNWHSNTALNLNPITSTSTNTTTSAFNELFLHQFGRFQLQDSQISLPGSDDERIEIDIASFTWLNQKHRRRAEGQIRLKGDHELPGNIQLRMDLSDKNGMLNTGNIWLQTDNLNMTRQNVSALALPLANLQASVSLQAWLQIRQGKIAEAILWLKDASATWQNTTPGNPPHQLSLTNIQAHITRLSAGWQLNIPKTNISLDQHIWPDGALSLAWLTADNQGHKQWRIRATQLDVSQLSALFTLLPDHFPQLTYWWQNLQPRGQLDMLALDLTPDVPQQTRFQAHWRDLSWQDWRELPGISHLSGTLQGDMTQGRLQLTSHQASVTNPRVFLKPLDIRQASGTLTWQNNAQNLTLTGRQLNIAAKSLDIQGDFHYQQPAQGQPWLSILAGISLTHAEDAWRYFPHNLMGQYLSNYLRQAIQSGSVSNAKLIYNGNPQRFPFNENEGVFQVLVPLKHSRFVFDPRWPALNNLSADLNFLNDGLWIHSNQLQLPGNIQASNLQASIPHYHQQQLTIKTELSGSGEAVGSYFKQTPLHDSLASTLDELQLSGAINAHLQLDIPLHAQPVQTYGEVWLNNNQLNIKPLNYQLSDLNGKFTFSDQKITGSNLQARWFNQPVKLNFNASETGQAWQIDVGLAGNWQARQPGALPAIIRQALTGNIPWQSKIAINLPHHKTDTLDYQIQLKGDLKNLNSHLPAPLNKHAGKLLPFNFSVSGNLQQFALSGSIGKLTRFNSRWRLKPGLTLERAILTSHSQQIPVLPASAKIDLSLPPIGENWLALLQSDKSSHPGTFSLNNVPLSIRTPVLSFAGQKWQQFILTSQPLNEGRELTLQAHEIDATLIQRPDTPWLADIRYLNYHPTDAASPFHSDTRQNPLPDFRHWPSLQLTCHHCQLWGKDYGMLSASLDAEGDSLKLTRGILENSVARLQLSGVWHRQGNRSVTHIQGSLQGQHLNRLTDFLSLDTPIKDTPFNAEYQLNWNNPPWQPDNTSLNGKLSINLGKGKITDIKTSQATRLLNLFSIDALLRRLHFDFRDKFTDGFYFDSINSNASISNGVLKTHDTLIKGLSADIAIEGHVSLPEQTLDLQATIAPALSTTVGVATAFAVNPLAGAAAYAASKVFRPLWSKISLLRYRITGTIEQPIIDEVLRQRHPSEKPEHSGK